MDNNLIHFTLLNVGKPLLEIMLSIITILMVYFIIKIAVQMGKGEDFVSKNIKKMQNSLGDALGSIPVLPVAGYDKDGVKKTHWIGAKDIFDVSRGESELLNRTVRNYQDKIDYKNEQQRKAIDLFGGDVGILSPDEKNDIRRYMEQPAEKLKRTGLGVLKDVKNNVIDKFEGSKGMNLLGKSDASIFWMGQFTTWLKNMQGNERSITVEHSKYFADWRDMIRNYKDENLADFLGNNEKYRKAYSEFFFGEDIRNWNELKELDISEKREDGKQAEQSKQQSEDQEQPEQPGQQSEQSGQQPEQSGQQSEQPVQQQSDAQEDGGEELGEE